MCVECVLAKKKLALTLRKKENIKGKETPFSESCG